MSNKDNYLAKFNNNLNVKYELFYQYLNKQFCIPYHQIFVINVLSS